MEKKKKVLFTATVDSHILHFHIPFLKMFKENGYEVHVATNGNEDIPYCDVKHKISFERSPFKINNLRAISELKKIIDEEKFDIIHTHTPMGSVVTRLAARNARKNGTRVIYTAHGFHFYKGAPLLNWLIFYPVEKYLSKYTDTLITINNEDYELAKRKFKKCYNIKLVPGVGVDSNKFNINMKAEEEQKIKEKFGFKKNDFIIIYVAELNKNKNQFMAIKAMKELVKENNDIKLLLVGKGEYEKKYKKLIEKLKLENNVILAGYRNDVPKLMKISNLAISCSNREGLPVNLIEAQMSGLPIIATNCRGNRDVLKEQHEYLIELNNEKKLSEYILKCKNEKRNKTKSNSKYELENILKSMYYIYGLENESKDNVFPKISVIVPIHNSEKFLEKCINSLINQTFKNLEIILLVDASTDRSFDICKRFKKIDNRIIIENVNYKNVSKTRNHGINISSGEYITFVDSDDFVEKDMYEKLYKNMKKNDCDIGICSFYYEKENGRIYKRNSGKNFVKTRDSYPFSLSYEMGMQGYVWNKLYSRALLLNKNQKIYFSDNINIMEDDLFNMEVFDKNLKFNYCFINEKLYHYVKHNTCASKQNYSLKNLDIFLVKIKQIDILEKNNVNANFKKVDYIILYTRDRFLMKRFNLIDNKIHMKIYKNYLKYRKEINFKNLSVKLKVELVISLYFPYIYIIWLYKENRMRRYNNESKQN